MSPLLKALVDAREALDEISTEDDVFEVVLTPNAFSQLRRWAEPGSVMPGATTFLIAAPSGFIRVTLKGHA